MDKNLEMLISNVAKSKGVKVNRLAIERIADILDDHTDLSERDKTQLILNAIDRASSIDNLEGNVVEGKNLINEILITCSENGIKLKRVPKSLENEINTNFEGANIQKRVIGESFGILQRQPDLTNSERREIIINSITDVLESNTDSFDSDGKFNVETFGIKLRDNLDEYRTYKRLTNDSDIDMLPTDFIQEMERDCFYDSFQTATLSPKEKKMRRLERLKLLKEKKKELLVARKLDKKVKVKKAHQKDRLKALNARISNAKKHHNKNVAELLKQRKQALLTKMGKAKTVSQIDSALTDATQMPISPESTDVAKDLAKEAVPTPEAPMGGGGGGGGGGGEEPQGQEQEQGQEEQQQEQGGEEEQPTPEQQASQVVNQNRRYAEQQTEEVPEEEMETEEEINDANPEEEESVLKSEDPMEELIDNEAFVGIGQQEESGNFGKIILGVIVIIVLYFGYKKFIK